jgi:hypothetical protein
MEKREEDRVSLDSLDPETALKALLAVDPKTEPVEKRERDDDDAPESTPDSHRSE